MKYLEFQNTFKPFILYSTSDILKQYPNFGRRRLVEWQKKGYVTKIRNKHYCFADAEKDLPFLHLAANQIYSPSYISLESALSAYGIIPEGVFSPTSISTLKTNNIETPLGLFIYKNIKPNLFFGYHLRRYKNRVYLFANLEKAILDYLYLFTTIKSDKDFDGLRWNKHLLNQELKVEQFKAYLHLFKSKALTKRVAVFFKWIDI